MKLMADGDSSSQATCVLTRTAALDLHRIDAQPRRAWGDDVAGRYLADRSAETPGGFTDCMETPPILT
ncbi:MAG: hypothetical protein IPK97_18990 [Ahniella sp.]|nr:hypothetical protein [Ahniella sp.]